jgi:hypothetical protein
MSGMPLALIAAVGALFVTSSHARAREMLQAERLHVPRGSGQIVSDASAGGRHALALVGSSAARGSVRLPAASRLDVVARAVGCSDGAPRLLGDPQAPRARRLA